MAVMNFDPSTDRYSQIELALQQRFIKVGAYTVHLMKPEEIKRLHDLADDDLFGRQELPNGLITQFIEIGNPYWQY